jgi:hypothetical protein
MLMRSRWEGAALAAVTRALAAGCGGGGGGASDASDTATAEAAAPAAAQTSSAPLAVTAADLDVYERGLRREIEVVRAAQERARAATTPAERAAAAQAQWADQTMPEGARSAGVPPERYREIREAVDGVLQTLDFQGKIDGPLTLDTTRVSPEMRERLRGDPLAALPPASAAAVRARLPRLAPIWAQYKELTAVAG